MKNKICLCGVLVSFFVFIHNPFIAFAFSDTRGHWACPQIDHLQSRELVNGYPDGSFRPDSHITRAEFVTMLVNIMNKKDEAVQLQKGDSAFGDVSCDFWAHGYIELAGELNYIHGDDQGRFNPLHIINRQEAVTIMVNALREELPEKAKLEFTDGEDVAEWALPAVSLAVQEGLVKGYPDNTFKPMQGLSRAEVSVLFENFLDIKGQKYQFYGTLLDINLSLRQVIVEIDGKEETFEFGSNVVVYRKGSQEPVTELVLPVQVFFDVNSDGKLSYAYIPEEMPESQIKMNFKSLPVYTEVYPVDDKVVKFTAEEIATRRSSFKDPGLSLETTKRAMRVQDFVNITGVSGRGQLVAVIDSGIDAGHPDLQETSDGYEKIIDFIDLTDEGRVTLSGKAEVTEDKHLLIGEFEVDIANIPNAGDEYIYGYLGTNFLPESIKKDLPDKRFLVVAAASQYYREYDTVYVDTDMDGQINDEQPLQKFGKKRQIASIGENKQKFNIILSEISFPDGYAKFGFDAVGHGTEVAGIVAAHGGIEGVAPGAQILSIKVMNRLGLAYLDKLESAVQLAADMGANIAVLSMGQYLLSQKEHESLNKLAGKMWETHGMLICMAAGNNGPGIGTVASTAAIKNILSVGAYATPQMWQNDYGWELDKPTLWYFSSAGPGADGIAAPAVVAPGSVVSTYPLWGDDIYHLNEGTSMAAPHAAGALALIMEAMSHQLYIKDSIAAYQGLLAGAERLEGYQAVEQGFGAINLVQAWNEIKRINDEYVSYSVEQFSPGYGIGQGFYSRELQPAHISVKIKNQSKLNKHLAVGGLADWIKPEQYALQIPADSERIVGIDYSRLDSPGLYSDFLVADDYNTPGWDVSVLQTVIVPYDLTEVKTGGIEQKGALGAGQFKRYFFAVPEGMESLEFDLEVGDKGRARMHIIAPTGYQEVSRYAGKGETQTDSSVKAVYDHPLPGTWEVVVYSSATLSAYDLHDSNYNLKTSVSGESAKSSKPDKKYLVTAYPHKFITGEKTRVTLNFFNAYTKMPADGIVSINNRLYEIENGQVTVEVVPESDTLEFTVAW